ncbi:unknown [Clostridium sp. CAG:389]|nr:unknown [Clostridium sp. CAG:389]
MQKKDKKSEKNNDEKSFAHAVISWDNPTYVKPLVISYR